jgi:hypothetical protein
VIIDRLEDMARKGTIFASLLPAVPVRPLVRKKRTETNKKALIAFGKPSAVFMTRCRVNHNEFSDSAGDARGYYWGFENKQSWVVARDMSELSA